MCIVKVKIADFKVASAPSVLATYGLGSCVGIALYDNETKTGGLAHIMLPAAKKVPDPAYFPRYADTALRLMMEELENLGCRRGNISAKLAGGASMFPGLSRGGLKGIGKRNVDAVVEHLEAMNIPIIGSDTGGDYGRSIEFYTENGEMIVSTVMHSVKVI